MQSRNTHKPEVTVSLQTNADRKYVIYDPAKPEHQLLPKITIPKKVYNKDAKRAAAIKQYKDILNEITLEKLWEVRNLSYEAANHKLFANCPKNITTNLHRFLGSLETTNNDIIIFEDLAGFTTIDELQQKLKIEDGKLCRKTNLRNNLHLSDVHACVQALLKKSCPALSFRVFEHLNWSIVSFSKLFPNLYGYLKIYDAKMLSTLLTTHLGQDIYELDITNASQIYIKKPLITLKKSSNQSNICNELTINNLVQTSHISPPTDPYVSVIQPTQQKTSDNHVRNSSNKAAIFPSALSTTTTMSRPSSFNDLSLRKIHEVIWDFVKNKWSVENALRFLNIDIDEFTNDFNGIHFLFKDHSPEIAEKALGTIYNEKIATYQDDTDHVSLQCVNRLRAYYNNHILRQLSTTRQTSTATTTTKRSLDLPDMQQKIRRTSYFTIANTIPLQHQDLNLSSTNTADKKMAINFLTHSEHQAVQVVRTQPTTTGLPAPNTTIPQAQQNTRATTIRQNYSNLFMPKSIQRNVPPPSTYSGKKSRTKRY